MNPGAIVASAVAVLLVGVPTTAHARQADSAPAQAPAIIPSNSKLDIDPTERVEIKGWWSNGKEIFLVKSDGAFVWWNQPNRFRAASMSGRWDRQNYRTFWLEPYALGPTDRETPKRLRVALRRTDGKIFADVETHLDFMLTEDPPLAPEDSYVGRWLGPGGALDLNTDGSYDLRASAQATQTPVTRSAHSGTWTYDGKYVLLRATGSVGDPELCTVVDRPAPDAKGSATKTPTIEALTTPIGELQKLPDPKPAATPALPPRPITTAPSSSP